MKEVHPLQQEPIYKAFPVLTPFKYCFRNCCEIFRTEEEQQAWLKARSTAIEEPLLDPHKKHLKHKPRPKKQQMKKAGDAADKDPIVKLGFGVVAYRDIVWSLIWTFVLFSVLCIPQIMSFR